MRDVPGLSGITDEVNAGYAVFERAVEILVSTKTYNHNHGVRSEPHFDIGNYLLVSSATSS